MKRIYTLLLAIVLPLFAVAETINVTASDLTVRDMNILGRSRIYFRASNDVYTVNIAVNATSPIGTFTTESLIEESSTIEWEDEGYYIETIDIKVEADGENYRLTGMLTCGDENEYVLDFSKADSKKSRDEVAVFPNVSIEYNEMTDQVYIEGTSDDGSLSLSLYLNGDIHEGKYSGEDIDKYSTYMIASQESSAYFEFLEGNLNATVSDGMITFTGKLLFRNFVDATDCPEYTMVISGALPGGYTGIISLSQDQVQEFRLNSHILIRDGNKYFE